jgi:hypothetical protein
MLPKRKITVNGDTEPSVSYEEVVTRGNAGGARRCPLYLAVHAGCASTLTL